MATERKKVVIVGDHACGKTTLVMRLITGEWKKHQDLVPVAYTNEVIIPDIDGKILELTLMDTTVRSGYDQLRQLAYSGAHLVIVCVGIDRSDTLENVMMEWSPEVGYFCPNAPILLHGRRRITPEMGEAIARRVGAERYLECSAKTGEGVKDVFEQAARASLQSRRRRISKELIFVGDADSGKTSLLWRYHKGYFASNYVPGLFGGGAVHVNVDTRSIRLALLDTVSGTEEQEIARTEGYSTAHAVVICFAVDQPKSLQNVRDRWMPEILHFCQNIPVLVVGCKTDMRDDHLALEWLKYQGQVPTTPEDGRKVANQIGAQIYLECSAKSNEGLSAVFEHAARIIPDLEGESERRSSGASLWRRLGSLLK